MFEINSRSVSENLPGDWPTINADLPRIDGDLKSCAEDFVVEEIPAYLPSGDGEHLFLWIEKTNVPADQLGRHLASVLEISPRELGTAGLKDTRAVTRQFVSVPRRAESRLGAIDTDRIRLLSATPHPHKLRTGHLRGNRFEIIIRNATLDAQSGDVVLVHTRAIADRLRQTGVPNYFGSQRFGNKLSTLKLGLRLLSEARVNSSANDAKPVRRDNRRFLNRLALSAAQSYLFNNVLAERLREGLLHQVMLGDVMQVSASGGIFDVRDVAAEQPRFESRETVLTGPMFGPNMRPARLEPGDREQRVLTAAGLTLDGFRRFGKLCEGTRRPLLIWPDDLHVVAVEIGLRFSFELRSGAYATVVLREFLNSESGGGE